MADRAIQQQRQGEPPRDCSAAVPAYDALLSRRQLICAGIGAAASVSMQDCGGRATAAATPGGGPPEQAFPQPPMLSSKDGVLEATLRVAQTEVQLWQATGPRLILTRAYNGAVPGPTLRVRARDQVCLLLVNDLPLDQSFCDGAWQEANQPHGFNVTNLHAHGLHVSPASRYSNGTSEPDRPGASPVLASDDVSLEIRPGARQWSVTLDRTI